MSKRATQAPPVVRCEELSTMQGGKPVLQRLWLEIPAGRRTVVLGPTGCGKTTLVRHLVGLDEPGAGEVKIGGRAVWRQGADSREEARRGLAAMLGGSRWSSMFGSISVFDNVAFQLELAGWKNDALTERVDTVLAELDLTDVADKLPEQIPEHARRRMTLARALAADAPLVILDSPEWGIDPDHADLVTMAILEAHRRRNATLVVVTSDVDLARRVAQHLAILCHGRIVADGDPEVLLDGVGSAEEFDKRYRVMDTVGPLQPEVTAAAIEQQNPPRNRTIHFDPLVLVAFAIGIVGVGLLILLADITG